MDFENKNLGLSIGFWNINGLLEEKSENDIYQKYINMFDIIFLSETWKSETSINKLQHPAGYLHVSICRKTKNKKGRASGGILGYYRKELNNFLSVLENNIWFKLSKGLLKTLRTSTFQVYTIARKTQVTQNITNVVL